MDCSDDLACTVDQCTGPGTCSNLPRADSCALPVKDPASGETRRSCFAKGARNPGDPCQVCDPARDPLRWSLASGGACDDGDPCTRDDACVSGTCKGIDFRSLCDDGLSCTTDVCDGKGGCLGNTLASDQCLINGACVKKGEKHPSGSCNECDPDKSPSRWTPIDNSCFIDSTCYKAGDSSPTLSCGTCTPALSTSAWSPTANTCLIGGTCYSDGARSADGCGECDPATSQTAWTALPSKCLISGICYADGTAHPQGCAKCDVSSSSSAWTITDSAYCLVSGSCAAKATSTEACGACGVSCNPGETCSGGACACGSLTGTVGGGGVCDKGKYCVNGACTSLPPGTLLAPLSLDFEASNGGLTGTRDWEWGPLGTFLNSSHCSSSAKPPSTGYSGKGVWGTKLNDCHNPLDNASSSCSNASTADDSVLTLKVKIPAGWTTATLSFWQWYDVFLTFDWSEIRVDGQVAAQTCTGSRPSPPGWTKRTLDLSAHAGKIITITFHFMATSVVNYAGWYIDDLSISGS
jgi:hypothetical protein